MKPGAFRLLLAFAVLINHFLGIMIGSTAVYLFFFLSGFWIWKMWEKEYLFTRHPKTIFLISRCWRIFPTFVAASVLTYGAASLLDRTNFAFPPVDSPGAAHLYFSGIFIIGFAQLQDNYKRFLAPAWSLDIELQFYIIAPFVIALFSSKKNRLWEIGLMSLALIGVCLLVTIFSDAGQSCYLPAYLIFFLLGLQAARWNRTPPEKLVSIVTALSLLAFVLIIASGARGMFLGGHFSSRFSNYMILANVIFACALLPYSLATVTQKRSDIRDRTFGDLSYQIYLFHNGVLVIMTDRLISYSRYQRMPYMLGAVLLIIVIAWAFHRFADRPLQRARSDFVKKQRRSSGLVPEIAAGSSP